MNIYRPVATIYSIVSSDGCSASREGCERLFRRLTAPLVSCPMEWYVALKDVVFSIVHICFLKV